jgi:hypothetical protein
MKDQQDKEKNESTKAKFEQEKEQDFEDLLSGKAQKKRD